MTPESTPTPEMPVVGELLLQFKKDPIAFIRKEIDTAIKAYLLVANEDGQARMAMQQFVKEHPDAEPVMSYILEEVARLIEEDTDGVLTPWNELFNQALENFTQKFQGTLKPSENTPPKERPKTPFVEQGKLPMKGSVPRSFTREEIGKMSPEEYLANEAAIQQAYKEKRIK
jgi:hypothetical protein